MNRKRKGDAEKLPMMPFRMLALGVLMTGIGWPLLGLSLGLTLEGLRPDLFGWTLDEFITLTATNAVAYVAGFLVLFAPAGAGAREIVMQTLLAAAWVGTFGNDAAGSLAVIAGLVVRLVWTVSEMTYAGLLYALGPKKLHIPAPPTEVPIEL